MCSGVPMHNLCLICVTDIRIPDDRSVLWSPNKLLY